MRSGLRTLAITLGDPCGLGPELVARTLRHDLPYPDERLLLIGPAAALERELAGAAPFYEPLADPREVAARGPGVYLAEPGGLDGLDLLLGAACAAGGLAAGKSLKMAVDLAKAGIIQGLVTCPLNKAMLQEAGFDFPGHTEFLAEGLGVGRENVTMHLCGPMQAAPMQAAPMQAAPMPPPHAPGEQPRPVLRVSLVTTHPPLADVPRLVTQGAVLRAIRHTSEFVKRLGLVNGKGGAIGVCGLNPHAGESGRIGREDVEVVAPAVEQARAEGLAVAGPIPADTLFHFAAKGCYPAVVAMYHDQGLAPLKLLHFGEAVNITLGLPIVRTSPDHGTGYDLVGTGKARLTSFQAALDMARRLAGA